MFAGEGEVRKIAFSRLQLTRLPLWVVSEKILYEYEGLWVPQIFWVVITTIECP